MNYLIETDSKVLLDQALEKILNDSQNKVIYSYQDTTIKEIIEEACYVSLFNDQKYIIVKNANFFGKDKLNDNDTKLLTSYLEHPSNLTTLIFTTYENVDKRKKIVKDYPGKFLSLHAPLGYELKNQIKKTINQEGYKIDDEQCDYLKEACLNNWDLIYNEIKKLSLLLKPNTKITTELLSQIIPKSVKDDTFKFVDAVTQKQMALSFKILDELKLLKIEPIAIINLLARQFRLMLYYKLLLKQNASPNQILSTLNIESWQLKKIAKEANIYHEDDLKQSLISLANLDVFLKNGKQDKWLGLINFLMIHFEY